MNSAMEKVDVYHARVTFTESQLKALKEEDSIKHTQPVSCLHFPYNTGTPDAENWAIFR